MLIQRYSVLFLGLMALVPACMGDVGLALVDVSLIILAMIIE